MLEEALIAYGAPTLARLKTGSLFSVRAEDGSEAEWRRVRAMLAPRGVALTALRRDPARALLYLYREDALRSTLARPEVRRFLAPYGYRRWEVEHALAALRLRLAAKEGFPHEIGIFLGYPLADVIGFIRHSGRDCLRTGCWKVYANEAEAERAFRRLRKCKEVYAGLFANGASLERLTVPSFSERGGCGG